MSLAADSGLRSYFDKAGALVCRPGDQSVSQMSAAIKAGGKLSIQDHVIFTKPSAFEIALTTRWKIKQTGPSTLEFTDAGKRLLAEVTTPAGFELSLTEIEELGAPPFTRIGFKLREPVKDATVRVTFSTVEK